LREIAAGLTLEHAILGILGLGLGIPVSVVAIKRVLALYSSDFFTLPFVRSVRTIVAAGLGTVAILLIAQWPALRRFSRASLADAVRVRGE
jgi:ABC-type antimicrobial peptide transport system permease subunit